MHLHLIDDDEELFELLNTYFSDYQIDLTYSPNPEHGINYVKNNNLDLVILDLMLPSIDGFEVCKKIREIKGNQPIIMLTAKGDDISKILGLELGADDYMSKPFNPRELLARIKTVLRRSNNNNIEEKKIINKFGINIDSDSRQVYINDKALDLTVTEYEILKELLDNIGIVQTRDNLINKIKGIDYESFDRSIDIYISRLRQKIGDNPKKPEMIKTVWGVGYIIPK